MSIPCSANFPAYSKSISFKSIFKGLCFVTVVPLQSDKSNSFPNLSNRKESIYKNVSFCEEGCTYKGIDYTTNSVSCECKVGGKDESLTSESLNNSPLGEFSDALSILNLELFKCIHLLTIPHLRVNVGHWILMSIIVLEIVFYIAFALFQMKKGLF